MLPTKPTAGATNPGVHAFAVLDPLQVMGQRSAGLEPRYRGPRFLRTRTGIDQCAAVPLRSADRSARCREGGMGPFGGSTARWG